MRIVVNIGHPAHVHLFKKVIQILKANGHDVLVTARNKGITLDIMYKLGIKCVKI